MPVVASSSRCVENSFCVCARRVMPDRGCVPIIIVECLEVEVRVHAPNASHGLHARAGADCPLSIGYLCSWPCRRHLCFKL